MKTQDIVTAIGVCKTIAKRAAKTATQSQYDQLVLDRATAVLTHLQEALEEVAYTEVSGGQP